MHMVMDGTHDRLYTADATQRGISSEMLSLHIGQRYCLYACVWGQQKRTALNVSGLRGASGLNASGSERGPPI